MDPKILNMGMSVKFSHVFSPLDVLTVSTFGEYYECHDILGLLENPGLRSGLIAGHTSKILLNIRVKTQFSLAALYPRVILCAFVSSPRSLLIANFLQPDYNFCKELVMG